MPEGDLWHDTICSGYVSRPVLQALDVSVSTWRVGLLTVKIGNIQTPEKLTIVIQKFEQCGFTIWARSCETCLMSYANNKGADQPAHPRSLISTFVFRCLDGMICILAISKVSLCYLASGAEQAGLSLTWSQTPEDRFPHDVAHIIM